MRNWLEIKLNDFLIKPSFQKVIIYISVEIPEGNVLTHVAMSFSKSYLYDR